MGTDKVIFVGEQPEMTSPEVAWPKEALSGTRSMLCATGSFAIPIVGTFHRKWTIQYETWFLCVIITPKETSYSSAPPPPPPPSSSTTTMIALKSHPKHVTNKNKTKHMKISHISFIWLLKIPSLEYYTTYLKTTNFICNYENKRGR